MLTKNELNNLFECCGISRANPYNVVQQGKIQRVSLMTAEEIYELLQDITGAKFYNAKRKETTKLLEDTSEDLHSRFTNLSSR